MKKIPYARQTIDDNDIAAVVEVLKSDFLTTGPKIEQFENELCNTTDAKYAVSISNGTAALHAACYAAGIGKGDEVITPAITFAASANCALYMGAVPIFADIDPKTYNISIDDIEKKITPRTKAIIPVHYTGQPCDMNGIQNIAKKYNLTVIEDAAHALGALYNGKKIGSISDMTTFSFHPLKHITTGEGGAITTNDFELYQKLLLFRSHGITRNPNLLEKNEGGWYYEQLDLGYNYRLTDIQAALGISQLKKLYKFIDRRKQIASLYNKAFKNNKNITIPQIGENCDHPWHLYVIKLNDELNRKNVYNALHECGIGVNVNYIPVYFHPYYRELGYKKGLCPNAEKLYEHIISIPMHNSLTDDDVELVINSVNKCCT